MWTCPSYLFFRIQKWSEDIQIKTESLVTCQPFFFLYLLVYLGYYCSGGATSSMPLDGVTGGICPRGNFCPMGSTSPVVCPDGTYSNTTGNHSCFSARIFNVKWKTLDIFLFLNKGAEVCEDCPTGTYCLSGEDVQLCPAGHYCLGGGVEGILPCPPGTYSPQFGHSQVEQCLICPAGESIAIWLALLLCKTLESLPWNELGWVLTCHMIYQMYGYMYRYILSYLKAMI